MKYFSVQFFVAAFVAFMVLIQAIDAIPAPYIIVPKSSPTKNESGNNKNENSGNGSGKEKNSIKNKKII